jgi:hypothetical protein
MKLSQYLDEEKIDFLKMEIDNLAGKINAAVDNLWKIRSLEMTLWIAATGVGLGQFSSNDQPILPLLLITLFIPIWFFWIDARYNRWYRRITMREYQIQKFINDDTYILPKTNSPIAPISRSSKQHGDYFPVYDISGNATFGDNPYFKWETTLTKSFTDTVPLFIYGSQVLVSALVLTIQFQPPLNFIFVPSIVSLFLVFSIYASLVKRKILRKSKKDSPT